jgi:hypothetical protein
MPEPAMRDQFADKVAHTARITAEVVQSEFRKIAAKRQTTLSSAELPSLGEVKKAEKALIWWLIQRPAEAREVLDTLDEEDLRAWRPVDLRDGAELAQDADRLPSA